MKNKWTYRLMTPGPVPLPPEVREVLSKPMLHHRTPQFNVALERVLDKLKSVFLTKESVLCLTSTGSGAMEAALINTLSPGDEILVVVSGKFGERWKEIAEAYGIKVSAMNLEWGEAVDLKNFEDHLKANPNLKAVLCQACETSTATLHPIREMSSLIQTHSSALFMVDAITALGATALPMDEWNLDVVVAGSQKAFMLPTGLSFIALSQKAWAAYETSNCPKYYFDLKKELIANQRGQTFFSSAVIHLLALDLVLNRLSGEALSKQIARSKGLAESLKMALDIFGLKLFSKAPSPSVTALLVPDGINGEKWRDLLEDQFKVVVMGGQDQLKGKILRIGHLGYITDEDQLATMEALGLSLNQLQPGFITDEQIAKALAVATKILNGASLH